MNAIIVTVFKLAGSLLIIVLAVWAFNHFTGYGEFYDKMMSGEGTSDRIANKDNKDNDEDQNSSSVN